MSLAAVIFLPLIGLVLVSAATYQLVKVINQWYAEGLDLDEDDERV